MSLHIDILASVSDPTADATWSAPTIISSLGSNQTFEQGLRMAVRAVSRCALLCVLLRYPASTLISTDAWIVWISEVQYCAAVHTNQRTAHPVCRAYKYEVKSRVLLLLKYDKFYTVQQKCL